MILLFFYVYFCNILLLSVLQFCVCVCFYCVLVFFTFVLPHILQTEPNVNEKCYAHNVCTMCHEKYPGNYIFCPQIIGVPRPGIALLCYCVCVEDADTLLLRLPRMLCSFFLCFFLFHFPTEIYASFSLETTTIDLKL